MTSSRWGTCGKSVLVVAALPVMLPLAVLYILLLVVVGAFIKDRRIHLGPRFHDL